MSMVTDRRRSSHWSFAIWKRSALSVRLAVSVMGWLCLSCALSAQAPLDSDPFGPNPFGRGGGDPFGGKAHSDPFGPGPSQQTKKQAATQPAHPKRPAKVIDSQYRDKLIRAKLNLPTAFNAVDLPLQELIVRLSQLHDIPMVIDRRALDEVGLLPEEPISISLSGVSLRSFLQIALRELDLTYVIKDEVLQVTTLNAAEENLVLVMHAFPESLVSRSDEVVKALVATVAPEAWEDQGGPCTLAVIDNVVVVRGTEKVHAAIADFMQKLDQALSGRKLAGSGA